MRHSDQRHSFHSPNTSKGSFQPSAPTPQQKQGNREQPFLALLLLGCCLALLLCLTLLFIGTNPGLVAAVLLLAQALHALVPSYCTKKAHEI
jgi:hypothetical protein